MHAYVCGVNDVRAQRAAAVVAVEVAAAEAEAATGWPQTITLLPRRAAMVTVHVRAPIVTMPADRPHRKQAQREQVRVEAENAGQQCVDRNWCAR